MRVGLRSLIFFGIGFGELVDIADFGIDEVVDIASCIGVCGARNSSGVTPSVGTGDQTTDAISIGKPEPMAALLRCTTTASSNNGGDPCCKMSVPLTKARPLGVDEVKAQIGGIGPARAADTHQDGVAFTGPGQELARDAGAGCWRVGKDHDVKAVEHGSGDICPVGPIDLVDKDNPVQRDTSFFDSGQTDPRSTHNGDPGTLLDGVGHQRQGQGQCASAAVNGHGRSPLDPTGTNEGL